MLSKFSVQKPYTVVVAVVMVLILGAISFINLSTDLLPSLNLPFIVVMTNYPGASPEEVELVVTKPIEQVVATTNNIKKISSISNENQSVVILEFNNSVNMDTAIIEINGSLDLIKGVWNDSISSPMVIRLNPDMLPIMIASVDIADMDAAELSKLVKEKVIPELESVDGVASVSGVGVIEESIEVVLSKEKIDNLNKILLDNVDAKLLQAENKLLEAKQEIKSGMNKLETENSKQTAQLVTGENVIDNAKAAITKADDGIVLGLLELNKKKTQLESSIAEINNGEKQLALAQSQLPTRKYFLSLTDKYKIEAISENLDKLAENKTKAIEALKLISSKIKELEAQKKIIENKKVELLAQEEKITQGKAILVAEMNKASTKLVNAENEIEKNLNQFKESRDEALDKASLDKVISKTMISGILTAQNFSMPAGYVTEDNTDYLVKVGSKFNNLDDIRNLLLVDTGSDAIGKVYLKDVTDIELTNNADESYAKVNGNDAVILTFQKQSNFSTSQVSDSIRNRIDKISEEIEGLTITTLMDQGIYINIVINSVLDNIFYGGILAILVLIFFLKDIRPTIIIAVSIPISIIFAIAMMYFSKITINIISLAGLALGVGMLVDNSIVVIENIYRLRGEGLSAPEAAIEGASEVAGAITASTLTTACVFLPLVFTKGISKQLFTDLGLTIAFSLIASLLVAITLVPTMASAMLRNNRDRDHNIFNKFINFYGRLLIVALKHKAVVMISIIGLFGLSIFYAISAGTSFIPEMETPQMSILLKLPKGSTSDETLAMTNKVIERIDAIEEIQTIGAFQSSTMSMGFDQGGSSNDVSMMMYLILDEKKSISNKDIGNEIKRLTKDLNVKVSISTSNMDMTALGGSGIEIIVKGREIDTLKDIGLDVASLLKETKGTTDVINESDDNSTETRIVVNKEKSIENGLTVAQVFASVNSILSKGRPATTLTIKNNDYPVKVIDGEAKDLHRTNLDGITIKGQKNGVEIDIPIGDIASISEEKGLSSIKRESQERYISVKAKVDSDYNIGLVSKAFEKKLKGYSLPEGYNIEIRGEREMINTYFGDLISMIILAIVFIYLIMVAQFQSLLSPFIVMFTIPLAFTGGLLALAITGYDISLIAGLGFLVLSGVVVNNGIVFVDYTNQLRKTGLDINESLILAGKTRIKPILMTAITTILGLLTLSFGFGIGAEMLQPLAIVVIGGLIYATLLTLFVVPIMYNLLHAKHNS